MVVGLAQQYERDPGSDHPALARPEGIHRLPEVGHPARIEENFDVFDFELSAEDLAAIDGCDTGNRIGGDPDQVN